LNTQNLIGIARYIPEWLPGNHFASFAKEAARTVAQLLEVPFDNCLQKIVTFIFAVR
jgi:hypothetical protein